MMENYGHYTDTMWLFVKGGGRISARDTMEQNESDFCEEGSSATEGGGWKTTVYSKQTD